MRIICPQCGYSRDIPTEKIPAKSNMATCPKCRFRFRFRGTPVPSRPDGGDNDPVYPPRPSRPDPDLSPLAPPSPVEPRIPWAHDAPEPKPERFETPAPQARWLPDPEPDERVPPAQAAKPGPPAHAEEEQARPERQPGRSAPLAAGPRAFEDAAPTRERSAFAPKTRQFAPPHDPEPPARHPAQARGHDAQYLESPVGENPADNHAWAEEAPVPQAEEGSMRPGQWDDEAGAHPGQWDEAGAHPDQWDERASDGQGAEPADEAQAPETGAMSGSDSVRDIWSRLQAMGDGDAPLSEGAAGAKDRSAAKATWENFEQHGVISAFAGTVKGVLFAPGDFFDQLLPMAGKVRALIFAVAVSVLVMIFALIWDYFGLKLGGLRNLGHTEGFQGLGTSAVGGIALLGLAPIFTIAFVFLDAALSHLLLGLVRAATRSFNETFRTLCYAGAPWILAVLPLPYAYLVGVILIWHMALQAISLRKLHEAGYPQVLASVLVKWSLYFMASFAMLHMLVTRG